MVQVPVLKKTFKILDNGGIPYEVYVVSRSEVRVYPMSYPDKYPVPPDWKAKKGTPIVFRGVKQILPGIENSCELGWSSGRCNHHGNSMLLRVGSTTYVYIGDHIMLFDAGDKIKEYYSPIGNSSVPYPYAIGAEYSYSLAYETRIKSSLLRKPLGLYRDPDETPLANNNRSNRKTQAIQSIVIRQHDQGGLPGQKMLYDFRRNRSG